MNEEIKLIENWDGSWRFYLPERYYELEERLEKVDSLYREKDDELIIEEALDILENEMPQHMGALMLLAGALARLNMIEEAFKILERKLAYVFLAFPRDFKLGESRLPYEYSENRPFLHLYFIYGLFLEFMGYFEEAVEVYEGLLNMDSEDPMFVREPVIRMYFRVNRPQDVLKVIEKYSDQMTSTLNYAKALALFKVGRVDEAKRQLTSAIEDDPIIAEELLKSEHPYGEDVKFPIEIEKGSEEEAKLYFQLYGEFWMNTEGALDLLRSVWRELH